MVPDQLLDALTSAAPRCGTVRVVAIDGGAASGKTSLANDLAARLAGTAVVHTDDLLDGWQDQFTFWARLRTQILQPLAEGRPAQYRRYEWLTGRFGDEVGVPIVRTLIVEGVSAIEACGDQLSLGILLDVARGERERRWRDRDGVLGQEARRWLDGEDAYFAGAPTGPRFVTSAPLIVLSGTPRCASTRASPARQV